MGAIEAEVEAAQRLGLPATFTTDTDLPFDVAGAVRFDDQALFHPREYCLGLAAAIPGDGSFVFETTRALDVDAGPPCSVRTDRGEVRAGHVVMATLLPFLDRGGFFAKCHPTRSYAMAVRVAGEATQGMYLSADTPTRSVRPHDGGDETLLVVSGEGHSAGHVVPSSFNLASARPRRSAASSTTLLGSSPREDPSLVIAWRRRVAFP